MPALPWTEPLPPLASASTSRSSPRLTASSSSSTSSSEYLSTAEGELAFFRALVSHRLVGPDKHFEAIALDEALRKQGKKVSVDEVWAKFRTVYDEAVLDKTWADQELAAIEAEKAELDAALNEEDDDGSDAQSSSHSSSATATDRAYSRVFAKSEFSLDPDAGTVIRSFERGMRGPGEGPESPVDAPLREVFFDPDKDVKRPKREAGDKAAKGDKDRKPTSMASTRSPRKRVASEKAAAAAASAASPRKRKGKQTAEVESGSELSELTDDDEEVNEDDEDGDEREDDESVNGTVEDSGAEDGTAASQIDEEAEEEDPEPAGSRKRKAPTSRGPPTSSKRTRNARSASVATSDSRTAAERRKDQSTPSRGRGSRAGGSNKKVVRTVKKK
ncbi:hypothetical protein JCM10212_000628 [Sporobolomyces blumeae]